MRKLVQVFALAFLLSALPISVNADEGPGLTYNGGGGEPTGPQPASAVLASKLKSEFFAGYYAHRKAGGTLADFKDLTALDDILNGGVPLELSVAMAYPAESSAMSLPSPQYQAQTNDYYCGPASAWVALKHLGMGNNYWGASLIQSNLATDYWLRTDTFLQTPRENNWRMTLNGWVDRTEEGWYLVHTYGSFAPAEDVASKFAANIDGYHAPIMNVWMTTTRGKLPGWQNYSDVKHYVPGFGYAQYGDYLHYVEVFNPATLGYKYNITKELFASIVASYGMIW